MTQASYIHWFDQIGIDDVPLVGGKNASLGEMYRELAPIGVKVPNGFAVTAQAYRYFLREAGLDQQIREIIEGLDTQNIANLRQRGKRVRHAIMAASLPTDLQQAIIEAYDQLSGPDHEWVDVAVRSSATAEDLPDASFAGQQENIPQRPGSYPAVRYVQAVFCIAVYRSGHLVPPGQGV